MNKNNKTGFVILIISMFVLIILIGTSFAYFATETSLENVMNVSVDIPHVNTIISTNSTQCDLNVNSTSMTQTNQSSFAMTNCSLEIQLSGTPGIFCSYDVVLKEEDANTNATYVPYQPTAGIGVDYTFEFTGTLEENYSDSTGNNHTVDLPYYNDGTDNITALNNEVQMDILTNNLLLSNNTNSNGVLVKAVIGVNNESTPVTHTYTFTEKWYNINKSQVGHSDRKYTYKLSAENIVC